MSIAACAEIVRRGDADRFLATMAAPVAARKILFPIYAFNVEVARAPWVTDEPLIAEMRLQWWHDALEEIKAGGSIRHHEVVTPLSEVIDGETVEILQRLIRARRWDLYKNPFDDEAHFAGYIDETSGGLALAAVRSAGGKMEEEPIRDVAWAAGLASWFLAVPQLAASGRFPLVNGSEAAIRDLAVEGLRRLASSRVPKDARAALLPCWRAGPLLRQIKSRPWRVLDGSLT